MDMSIPERELYSTHYTELKNLYHQNLFRDLWNRAEHLWGNNPWPTAELELLRARTLSNLGNDRASNALIWHLWRKNPTLPGLSPLIASLYRQSKPLIALKMLPIIEQNANPNVTDIASLRAEKAETLIRFRDFAAAEECLSDLASWGNDWHWISLATVKYAQDDYAQALDILSQILERNPGFRPAILFKANILQLQDDLTQAIATLLDVWKNSQSFWVGRALCSLFIESQQYTDAYECLERLKTLPAFSSKDSERILRSLQADLLCAEQRYDEALDYIEQKSFYGKTVVDTIKRNASGKAKKVLDVPFVRQANMTCAPASITAVAAYWGSVVAQADVIEAICYGGTQAIDERRWAEENGWYVQEFQLNYSLAKNLIDLGIPVLLATVEPGSAHLQVLVGYDETMGTYLLRDPYHRRLQQMLVDASHEYYAASGPRAMVMAPLSYSEKIKSLNLTCSTLYDCLYQINCALKKNLRELAIEQLATARHLDEHHRLTIICERAVAIYDGDDARILATTEKLLALFPQDVNFQLSKVSSLYSLGSSKQMLDYLRPIAEQASSHFLLRSRLADHLRNDHRELARVELLYKNLLKASPIYTENLYSYAGVLWDKANYIESYQLYRFATCLEDTNERYAESFFKAARYHKETDKGLDFLRDRFFRFGKKSSGAAISLFNALDSLELTHEGLAVLDQAIDMRPEDGWLMTFTARKLLNQHQAARAMELVERAKPLVSEVRYNELVSEIFELKLQPDLAIQCLEKILQLEPLNTKANRSIMRLLIESGDRVKANDFIAQQLKKYPENSMLLELYIDWLDKGDYKAHVSGYEQFIQYHPMNAWGYRGLSDALCNLEMYDQALTAAEEAIAVANNSSASHYYHGRVLFAKQQPEAARQSFRKAIELSCDYTYAYSLLLQCGFNHQTQQEDLRFIYEQLMAQVSYGDGLLEYQKIAGQFFSFEEIIQFLEHALEVRPDLWHSWVALTLAYRDQGENLKALQLIERAAKRFPLLPRLFLELADSHRLLNRFDLAEQYYRHALELSPTWTTPANSLCDLLERQGRYDEAISIQKTSMARNPLATSPYGYLADLYIHEQRIDEAILTLEQVLEIDPHYLWGWRTLFKLQNERANGQLVLDKLAAVCNVFSGDGGLTLTYTSLLEDKVKASVILSAFLEKNPYHIEVCIEYVGCQVALGYIDHALQFTSEAYWNNNRPLAILVAESRSYAEQRDMTNAITRMEKVVSINSNFYDGWRYLARWYSDANIKEKAQLAIDHCVRLYPNDPGVLCYAAERMQSIEGDEKRIGDLLQRTFELDPLNQYNGLTYIDYILDQGEVERATDALALLERHQSDIYTRVRAFRIYILKKDIELALDIYRKALQDKNCPGWFIKNAWEDFNKANYGDNAISIIRDLRARQELFVDDAGHSLAEFELQQLGLQKFEQELLKKELVDDFDKRYLEAYIRKLIDSKAYLPWKIIEKHQSVLVGDVKNWGLVGYLHAVEDRWSEAVNWFRRGTQLAEAEARSLYFYSLSLRETGKWDEGVAVMKDAFKQAPDAYREDVVVWYALDQLLEGSTAPMGELDFIRVDQLAGMSIYPFKLTKLLTKSNQRSFEDTYLELANDYLECRQSFGKIDAMSWRHARKLIRSYLAKNLQQQGLARWLWWLKIASRI
jgi:tetratricopeptide (TPR) repeat protein